MKGFSQSAKSGVLAAFAADSVALGAHWIYDVQQIKNRFGRVDGLKAPSPDSQHRGKKAGDFTHYGDQMLTLLESLHGSGGFDLQDFFRRWRGLFADYSGYFDMATRTTLKNIERGAGPEESGSKSHDLAGASRFAPLTAFYADDVENLVAAARGQAKMTHDYSIVIDAAEFFARTAHAVIHGEPPVEAMRKAAEFQYEGLPAGQWTDAGIKAAGTDTVSATLEFGQTCHVDHAFKSTVQVIARHAGDPAEAIIETVMVGGDSSARGILAGLILGADPDAKPLPEEWFSGLQKAEEIQNLLAAA